MFVCLYVCLQSTKRGMKIRYDTFGSVQEMITLRAAVYFKSNLRGRGYVGELLFDHEKETLELKVSGVGCTSHTVVSLCTSTVVSLSRDVNHSCCNLMSTNGSDLQWLSVIHCYCLSSYQLHTV